MSVNTEECGCGTPVERGDARCRQCLEARVTELERAVLRVLWWATLDKRDLGADELEAQAHTFSQARKLAKEGAS